MSTLRDRNFGHRLVREFYQAEQENLGDKSFADTIKLTDAVLRDLGDHTWAQDLVNKAELSAQDHFDLPLPHNSPHGLTIPQERARSINERQIIVVSPKSYYNWWRVCGKTRSMSKH